MINFNILSKLKENFGVGYKVNPADDEWIKLWNNQFKNRLEFLRTARNLRENGPPYLRDDLTLFSGTN